MELKPCPFCGGRAEIKTDSNGVDYYGLFSQLHSVVCTKCGATTAKSYKSEFRRGINGFQILKDGYEEATADWNRRVN